MDNDMFADFLSDEENEDSKDLDELVESYLESKGISAFNAIEVVGNDIDSYVELVDIFVSVTPERINDMKEFITSGDMLNYSVLAHSTKSDALLVGAEKLSELAKGHELEAKQDNITYVKENWDSLIEEWERVLSIYEEFMAQM
ncbi:MAG: Hpt domain-containing protein [Lachnospiraceae bacterium]|nr:Hpt domain-containing protein [Lachnospiraceae bacterium]